MKRKSKEAKLREVARNSLANKKRADELVDAVIELQGKVNALLAKLDADTGVASTNYAATLAVSEIED